MSAVSTQPRIWVWGKRRWIETYNATRVWSTLTTLNCIRNVQRLLPCSIVYTTDSTTRVHACACTFLHGVLSRFRIMASCTGRAHLFTLSRKGEITHEVKEGHRIHPSTLRPSDVSFVQCINYINLNSHAKGTLCGVLTTMMIPLLRRRWRFLFVDPPWPIWLWFVLLLVMLVWIVSYMTPHVFHFMSYFSFSAEEGEEMSSTCTGSHNPKST